MNKYEQIKITKDGVESTIEVDATDLVFDGYHTFKELYDHRITLWIALCKALQDWKYPPALRNDFNDGYDKRVWRSKKHHKRDADMYEGWFVLGYSQEKGGQITYHLPLSRWDECDFAETLEHAPKFDGHSPSDVIERLKRL